MTPAPARPGRVPAGGRAGACTRSEAEAGVLSVAAAHRSGVHPARLKVLLAKRRETGYLSRKIEASGSGGVDLRHDNDTADRWSGLLSATADGNKEAFEVLYRETGGRLLAIAMRMVGRRDLAEDILQEAFVAIWRRAGQFDQDRGQPFTWMAAIVRYRAIDRLRADRRVRDETELPEEVALPESLITDPRPAVPEAIAVRDCLGRLSADQRRAILFAYYYGLTHEELANRVDAPLGTVKSWVRRGLAQLKVCLET